ncbi:MAG: peptidase M23 [Flavobacteriaceae bacterium]|nr:peptidase M23 [Flavobacteriaceae bacterium]|tara:strand:- start:6664 stop:7914 length:1251 start_codon:yes stop_codon:yes gene_type:complete
MGCQFNESSNYVSSDIDNVKLIPNFRYGYDLNNFHIKTKKIKRGDTFGSIMEKEGIDYPDVHDILEKTKKQVNTRKLKIGKSYTLLYSNDSLSVPYAIIYEPDLATYWRIQLRDSIFGETIKKSIRIVTLEAAGVINSSLYETMLENGLNEQLTYYLSDVYAWTIDFFRLQKGNRFKVIYTEKFVDDSISLGIEKIKAAYFEHNNRGLYAFEFETDTKKGIIDYFDENANNLRRAFLKAPVKYSRISSRYNLKRRIAYYGNRVRPHKGTDFAASVGTPIMATANGKVIKSSYSKANGNYVTIKHNNTYKTQYLHMKKRKVKRGQNVKQGDVIGWVGMTGYTSGPHVCYRFWKNGRQVDPFRQKLPQAKPISNKLKKQYLSLMEPLKLDLDCVPFEPEFLNSLTNVDEQTKNNETTK